jgi:hypothetical protein
MGFTRFGTGLFLAVEINLYVEFANESFARLALGLLTDLVFTLTFILARFTH